MTRIVSTVCAFSNSSLRLSRFSLSALLFTVGVTVGVIGGACGGDDGGSGIDAGNGDSLFPERPECTGESIVPLAGQQQMLMSFLEVGTVDDGFDLDNDGLPDNKLAGVGTLANDAVRDSFDAFDIIIPLEFFDTQAALGPDECIKFGIYLGNYKFDNDGDGDDTADDNGDCNDLVAAINKGAAEIAGNGIDDNCNGLADEIDINTPSTNTDDTDGDLVTIADGDCDDNNAMVMGPGTPEICGDGLDNDCDGNADFGMNGGVPACTPYDDTPDLLGLDPLAFEGGAPVIAFPAGSISAKPGGGFALEAGPSIFSIAIPVSDDITLSLAVSGATIEADVEETANGWALNNGRLGGVIDGRTADRIRGLDVEQIGLSPEDSLLDAIYANILGTILGLPKVNVMGFECQTGDIDVDRDGFEAFCDTTPNDEESKKVDMCVDGDGTVIMDELDANGDVVTECSEALDADGKPRFVDGISVEFNFRTVPTLLPATLPAAAAL